MRHITPRLIEIKQFTVTGSSTRTRNDDEFNAEKARLPGLWAQFFSRDMDKRNANPDNAFIYGVYADYESDASGYYTVTAGMDIAGKSSIDCNSVIIQSGNYLVFENEGENPKAIIETWQAIWQYFERSSTQELRRFVTDFEQYINPEQHAVYIGIK